MAEETFFTFSALYISPFSSVIKAWSSLSSPRRSPVRRTSFTVYFSPSVMLIVT